MDGPNNRPWQRDYTIKQTLVIAETREPRVIDQTLAPGTLLREPDRLAAAGILLRKSVGNQAQFQASDACPIYEELRSILKKTAGVADVLRVALEPAGDTLRREVHPNVYPPEEFATKLAAGEPFLERVMADRKIFLIGAEDDLGQLAAHRKAQAARAEQARDRAPARRGPSAGSRTRASRRLVPTRGSTSRTVQRGTRATTAACRFRTPWRRNARRRPPCFCGRFARGWRPIVPSFVEGRRENGV